MHHLRMLGEPGCCGGSALVWYVPFLLLPCWLTSRSLFSAPPLNLSSAQGWKKAAEMHLHDKDEA